MASVLLIVATATIYDQINYMRNYDIGYNKDHIIKIALRGDSVALYEALKNRLRSDDRIVNISGSAEGFPYWQLSTDAVDWVGKTPDRYILVHVNSVDYDLVETLGIQLVDGRSFSQDHAVDAAGSSYLINETMAEALTQGSAVGKQLTMWDNQGEVIGVMKDFHFQPLSASIAPLVLLLNPEQVRVVTLKLPSEDLSSTLTYLEETWSELAPNFPFEYSILDQDFGVVYQSMDQAGNIAGGFSGIAVFVACLGLLGLASFAVQSRSKEIAVRKVLGAAIPRIVMTLSRELIGCVLLANLIAWPCAYLIMKEWLESYAYRVTVGPTVFILAFSLTLAAAGQP